jgi:hypothetical protein
VLVLVLEQQLVLHKYLLVLELQKEMELELQQPLLMKKTL